MYKNKLCFFLFITQNVWMGRVRRVEDCSAAHTGTNIRIFCEVLSSSNCSGRDLPVI